jgi:toxin ParE1/3/4
MADYRLSEAADADVESIYHYGCEAFGARQAEIYFARLMYVFDMLAEFPRMGGLLQFRCESHMVFYAIEVDGILIQRVFHGRADFPTRV